MNQLNAHNNMYSNLEPQKKLKPPIMHLKKNKKRIVRQKTKRRISVTYSLPTYIPTIRFAIGHPLKRTYSEDLLIKYVQKQVRIRQYFSKNIQKLSKSPIKSTKQT